MSGESYLLKKKKLLNKIFRSENLLSKFKTQNLNWSKSCDYNWIFCYFSYIISYGAHMYMAHLCVRTLPPSVTLCCAVQIWKHCYICALLCAYTHHTSTYSSEKFLLSDNIGFNSCDVQRLCKIKFINYSTKNERKIEMKNSIGYYIENRWN